MKHLSILLFILLLLGCTSVLPTESDETAVAPLPTIIDTATAVPASTPTTESIPVEVTRMVVTALPSLTPAVCTPLPEGMTFTITPTSDTAVALEFTGLQPGEELHLIFSQNKPDGEYQVEEWGMEPVGQDGSFSFMTDLTSPYEYPNWQIKVIHARGVACTEITLPEGEMAVPDTPWPEYSNESLYFSLHYPTGWEIIEENNIVYLFSDKWLELEPDSVRYSVSIDEYLNLDNLPFPDAINASFNVDFPTITNFKEITVGPYLAYRTTDLPSRADALSVLVVGNGRYLNLALKPYLADQPYPEQDQFVSIFEEILATLQLNDAMRAVPSTASLTPQINCPDPLVDEMVGTLVENELFTIYTNPVLGVELTSPEKLCIHEPDYLLDSYGFTLSDPETWEGVLLSVDWLYQATPDQLEVYVQEAVSSSPELNVNRETITVDGEAGVMLWPLPGTEATTQIYLVANARLYRLIIWRAPLDEQTQTLLDSLHFVEPTQSLESLDLPEEG